MGAMQRNKGAKFEQLVARMLTKDTGAQWRRRVRNLEGESDITPDDPRLGHVSIECKHATTLCLPEWWRQAQEQAERAAQLALAPCLPVLVYRKTRSPSIWVRLDAHHVSPGTWPVAGRHTITLEWDGFIQWLREQVPAA